MYISLLQIPISVYLPVTNFYFCISPCYKFLFLYISLLKIYISVYLPISNFSLASSIFPAKQRCTMYITVLITHNWLQLFLFFFYLSPNLSHLSFAQLYSNGSIYLPVSLLYCICISYILPPYLISHMPSRYTALAQLLLYSIQYCTVYVSYIPLYSMICLPPYLIFPPGSI